MGRRGPRKLLQRTNRERGSYRRLNVALRDEQQRLRVQVAGAGTPAFHAKRTERRAASELLLVVQGDRLVGLA
jgi:hypothetical protein